MKYIKTNYDIPFYNMALEEYLLKNDEFKDDYCFFYINSPSVIIGSHQNAYSEVNMKYARENNIYIARRLSGGGAVYHDKGNLNYSFVLNKENGAGMKIDFAPYTAPIITTLLRLGVKSELSGRNDILVDNKKISGNAQTAYKNKLLHHGTLMVDVDVTAMLNVLNVSEMKISSKAIDSVRSRVLNLKSLLPSGFDTFALRDELIKTYFRGKEYGEYTLDKKDTDNINTMVKEKFSTNEYNLSQKAPFGVVKRKKFTAGIIEAGFNVKNNRIEGISFCGDFFENDSIRQLEGILSNVPFNQKDIKERLLNINAGDYIANLTNDELIELIMY